MRICLLDITILYIARIISLAYFRLKRFIIFNVNSIGNLDVGNSGKWRHCASKNVGVSEETLALTSDLIGRRVRYFTLYVIFSHSN